MGYFSKRQTDPGAIVSPEDLVKFWLSFTSHLVYSIERNGKKAGLDMFGSPVTRNGVFGVPTNHMLAFILNSLHKNNLLSANVLYPLSRNDATTLIVGLGPLWITSIHDMHENNLYKLPSKVDAEYVLLAALTTLSAILLFINSQKLDAPGSDS